jgi:hypothetical protein
MNAWQIAEDRNRLQPLHKNRRKKAIVFPRSDQLFTRSETFHFSSATTAHRFQLGPIKVKMVTLSSRGESGSIPKNAVARKPRTLQPVFWELLSPNTDFGLEALQTLLGISKSAPSTTIMQNLSLGCKDPVFVSIDTEPWMDESGEREFVRELGISILDARILEDSTIQNPHSALSTFNYTTQRNIVIKRQGVNEKSIFRHGPTQYIEKGGLKWLVRKVLRNSSPDPACTEI